MLLESSLPLQFWRHCVLSATYLINKTPTKLLNGKTPYEVLRGLRPNYEDINVFRCLCYARNHEPNRHKFDARTIKCIFVH